MLFYSEISEPAPLNDRDLARIMEIGFSAEQARDALILSRGDFLQAVNDLFANKDVYVLYKSNICTNH